MSDIPVALIAEGATDRIVIEAALNQLLEGPFTLTLLQPEGSHALRGFGAMGSGWGGV